VTEGLAESVRTLAGRYELGEPIGHGGMSDVFLGTDTRLGRRVAIKLLHAELAEDPQFRVRFRREAQDAAKMTHPTIVRIFDAGEEAVTGTDGAERLVPFIVMEHIDGELLSAVIARGPVPAEESARIVEQILTALEYSHRAGIVHRDIKPGNVMLTPGGQVKVMDFGIARAISDSAATIAETSGIVGTAQYFSPEQARGVAIDARSDLYSTGVVLFELLTGRAPFGGDNPVAVAYQHVNAAPPIPSTLAAGITPALDAVVLKSLAKEPAERYPSAADFRADLSAAVTGDLAVKRAPRADEFSAALFGSQAAAAQAAQRQLSTDVDDRALRTQSGPPVLWLWAGIVVLLGITAAVIYWVFTLQPQNLAQDLVVEVPDVVGTRFEDGVNRLVDENGLVVVRVDEANETVASGLILRTEPSAGTTVERGQQVQVFVSSGPSPVDIPDVSRMDEASARATLEGVGFQVGTVTTSTSVDVPAGLVVSSDPVGGSGAPPATLGTVINLVVSNGLVTVPDMVGKPLAEANTVFSNLRLQITNTTWDASCTGLTLKAQSIVGDVAQGSPISLVSCQP